MKRKLQLVILMFFVFTQLEAQNIVTTIAGNGTSGFGGDGGLASNAMIGNVSGVATDALGNIYFADFSNARIRKINSAGIITTIAGNGTLGSTGDGGLAVNAQIAPAQIALDAMGNLYFGENVKVRKITMSTGIITTVAGTGALGHSGDGGLAVNATFDYIDGITVDAAGNIFITDNNAFVVRKVTASTGIINIYAGNGTNTYSGDGGQAINAGLGYVSRLVVDGSGNLFISGANNTSVRKVNASGIISTFAGNPNVTGNPLGLATDASGSLFFADPSAYAVKKITSSGIFSIYAGNGTPGFSGDGGLGINAQFDYPKELATDASGNVYITDFNNYRIRKVAAAPESIVGVEYFFDTDPGVGLATLIAANGDSVIFNNYSIPVTGLSAGIHTLYIRAKTNSKLWSVVDQRTFYIQDIAAGYINNNKIEYFIDNDPGVDNGINIPINAADTITLTNYSIPTTGLASGIHNLYVRAKTSNNLWNVIDQRTFYVESSSTNAVTEITKLEYFFDTDPGVGNATDWDISALPPNDTITFTNANSTVPCLSNGQHFMFLRAKNNLGVWSVIDFDTITVSGGIAAPLITANGATTFCAGSNVVLSTPAQGDLVYQWFNNGDTIIGQTTSTITVTLAGTYTLKISCNGNIIISNSITVVTNTPTTWYRDYDLDNYGDNNTTLSSCIQPSGYILNNTDCNDANSNVNPLATELCDALDNDCNTIIDDINAPFTASITASNASVCPGEDVTLNASPTGANYVYQWSTGETNASITVLNIGTYTVTITNLNTLCADDYSIVLNAGSTPLVTAFNSGPYCSGNTIQLSITGQNLISYAWSGPNNYNSSQASPSIANATVANDGNYSVIVTATNGCTGTASTGVVVYALPSLNISQLPVAPVCPGIDITLTANAPTAISYLWNNTTTSSSRIVNTSGNYAVTVTDANSCSESASYTVAYDPVIEITPNNISAICSGASLTIYFNNSVSTLWSTGANTPSITVSPTTATNYTVQGTSAAGCVYNDTLLLSVQPNTVQTVSNLIPSDNSFNLNTTIDFSWAPAPDASEYDLYVWKAINSRPVIPTVANAANITAHVGGLSYGTDYLWQVFSKNSCAVAESDTQHFSTVPLPDLIVDSVTAPTSAFSHSNISVTWRVTNTGLGPTGSSFWHDQVHLSVDNIFDPADDPKVGEFGNLSFLNSGESYLRTESVFIPVNYVGTYYLFVVSDLQVLKSFVGYVSNVLESNEINNSLAAPSPIAISVPAAPDLIVTSVGAPTSAFGLDSISVTYTVKNRYPTTANGNWAEAIFVSVDSNFNVSNATLLRLVSSPVSTLLYDSTYTKIVKVQLPDSLYGTKWLHVVTDYTNVVFEATTENNNSGTITAPLQVTLYPPADLAATAINVPSAFSSGQTINVSYTVENQGAHTPIVNYWIDNVYLSSMSTFDANASVLLKTITYSTGTTLNPGNTYTKQYTVNIPNGISGTYYLYVFTDAGNNVFEYTYTANNILRSSALNVSLTPYPDLIVSSLNVTEDTVMSGTLFNLAWTISNQGTAPTDNSWKDNIGYFTSSNTSVGGTDFVTFSSTTSSLLNGNSTSRTASIVAPTFSGSVKIYFLMKTDALNSNYEYQFENNNFSVLDSLVVLPIPVPPCDLIIAASTSPGSANSGQPISLSWTAHNAGPDSTKATYWNDIVYLSTDQLIDAFDYKLCNVQHPGALQSSQSYTVNSSGTIPNGYSGNYYLLFKVDNYNSVYNDQNFNNTLLIVPINIQLTPSADLIVTAVSVPAPLYAGQSVYLRYTVKNNGPATMPSVSVSDRAFISNSPTPNGVTHQLAATSNVRSLSVNQTYTDSVLITIPIYLSGNKYLILKTDNRDSVYEYTNEGNNFGSLAVNLLPAPIYDLQISQLQLPSSLLLGQDVRIPYTITNSGTIPVSSTVKNAAYYSIDNQYSSAIDPVLATRNALLSLAPGASLIDTFDTKVKDVNAGNYFGVGRTNILNTLLETNYANNISVTATTTAVDAAALTLNVTDSNQLNTNDLVYYKVTVGVDLDMLITLTSDNQSVFNEMYVAYNRTPSGTDYDFRHQSQNKANQRVLVPATQAGTYYVLIKTSTLTPNPQNINVLAVTLPFSLLSITPNHLGQGIVTTVIDGAGFRQGMNIYLKNGSSTISQATITEFTSSMSVKVRWDLTNVATGTYDLVAQNPDLAEVMIAGGVTVEEATPFTIGEIDFFPKTIKAGSVVLYTVTIENIGNVDIPVAKGEISFYGFVDVKNVSKFGEGFLLSDIIDQTLLPMDYNGCCTNIADNKPIPFIIRNMAPGQQFNIAAELGNMVYDNCPIKFRAKGISVESFILKYAQLLEITRQSLLPDLYDQLTNFPTVQNLLLNDVALRDHVFAEMVTGGLITQAELASVTFPCASCGDFTVQPGFSPGIVSFVNYNLGNLGYQWEINDPNGNPGRDPGWNLLQTSNAINIISTPTSPCIIYVRSLSSYNSSIDFLTTWEPGYNHRWPIAIANGGISGYAANKFLIDYSIFAAHNDLHGGSFSVSLSTVNNDTLYLNFIARIPNPGEDGFAGGPGQPGRKGGKGGKGGEGNCLVSSGNGGDGGKGGIGISAPNILPNDGGDGGDGGTSVCQGVEDGHGGNGGNGGKGFAVRNTDNGISYGQTGGNGGNGGNGSIGGNGGNGGTGNNGGYGGNGGDGITGGNGGNGGDGYSCGGNGGKGGSFSGIGGNGGNGIISGGEPGDGGDEANMNAVLSPAPAGTSGYIVPPFTFPPVIYPPTPPGFYQGLPPHLEIPTCESGGLANELTETCEEVLADVKCGRSGTKCLALIGKTVTLGSPACAYITELEGPAAGLVCEERLLSLAILKCLMSILKCEFGFSSEVTSVASCALAFFPIPDPTSLLLSCGFVRCDIIRVLLGCDPNEIIGPTGVDSAKWVSPYDNKQYTIHFENDSLLATAPAQRVTIRQKLHTNVNPFTVNIGNFGFANHVFSVPANSSSYSTRLALTDSLGVDVDVTAGIDVVNREVFWVLQSVDRNTGIAPYSPLLGLLPINNAAGDGQGFVSYSIKAKSPVNTGDSITAKASIVFDINDPIETNTWVNIIDAVAPTSSIDSLPSNTTADSVIISWSGNDDAGGSGIAFYDIYVSDNNSPYQLLYTDQPDTFKVFHGVSGHSYSFYSRATDRVGNRESIKTNADATILFGTATATLNLRVFLEGYYSGAGLMQSVLFNAGLSDSLTYCDSIVVELYDPLLFDLIRSDTVILKTTGFASVIYIPTILYPDIILGGSYYIVIRSRNTIETWSKLPVTMGTNTIYDFTTP